MNAILKSETDEVLHQNLGPGGRLRAERERQGLPRERVAQQLHLGEEMIDALEADDYDRLPGAVFVKGYVRNYARLLGIPAEPLLAELYERCPDQECSRFVTGNVRQEVGSGHLVMRLITAAIVIGLIALLGIWWWNYAHAPRADEAANGADTKDRRHAATPPREQSDAGLVDSLSAPAAGAPTPVSPTPAAITPPPSAARPRPPTVASAPVVEPPRQAAAPEPIVAPKPVAASPGKVEITFLKPSWVDIRGADGSFKMIGEFRKGRRALGGHGPYRFVIGKASAVRVTIDGEPYSLKPHTSGNVARFRLDPTKAVSN